MKTKNIREEKLNDGQTYDGFHFKGRKYGCLTAASLKFLQRIGSPLYSNDFEGKSEIDIILDYLFAVSATPEELKYAVDHWDIVQYEFANQFSVKELADPIIVESITRDLTNQQAASFTLISKESSSKKSKATAPTG